MKKHQRPIHRKAMIEVGRAVIENGGMSAEELAAYKNNRLLSYVANRAEVEISQWQRMEATFSPEAAELLDWHTEQVAQQYAVSLDVARSIVVEACVTKYCIEAMELAQAEDRK